MEKYFGYWKKNGGSPERRHEFDGSSIGLGRRRKNNPWFSHHLRVYSSQRGVRGQPQQLANLGQLLVGCAL
jgi:hypothetical protein